MNRLKFILFIALSLCISLPAAADQTKSLSITIYNNDRALVNEVRSMELPKGQERVEFLGVPQTIEPQTLRVLSRSASKKFRVLEMNYEYDLVATKTLLDRYVGKELTVILPDPSDATGRMLKKGTLIANNDRPIFRIGSEIYVGDHEAILLPNLPEGLRAKPALVWLVENKGAAKQDVEVSYLARSIGWKADYVLKVDRDNKSAGLSGWVTLTNNSGMAFENAELKLVAGDVHEVPVPAPMFRAKGMAMEASVADDMQEESFFEYHLYSMQRPVTIADKQIKQVSLLQAPKISVEKELISEHHTFTNARSAKAKPVDVYLKLKNTKASGLGLALPKGVVRAYQESSDGSVLFIGEDRMEHTPKGEKVRLAVGKSFDVTVERIQTDSKTTGKNSYSMTWKIMVRNASDTTRTVILKEYLAGQWKVTKASHKYTRMGTAGIEYKVQVPPTKSGKGIVLTYEADITH